MANTRKLSLVLFLVFVLTFAFTSVAIAKNQNILNVQMWEIKDWDPHICYSSGMITLWDIYEGLVRYEDGKVIPWLATAWEMSEGGRVWTFKLRKGVKFHNGELFNAQAVKFSIERLLKLQGGAAWNFAPIIEIKAIDDNTVQFRCENPEPVDLMMTSMYGPYIMPPKLTQEKGSAWFQKGNTCGTGPYKLKSYEKGVIAVLEKFDGYWGGWKPNQFDLVFYRIVNETSTGIQLLKKGEMDIYGDVPLDMRADLEQHPDIESVSSPAMYNFFYHLHNQKFPTDDINVRKAICHAINIEEMIETIIGKESATRSIGPLPKTMWGHDPNLKTYDYNPEKARTLLETSKYAEQWKKGQLKMTLTSYQEYTLGMATYIQAALRKVGIVADIDTTLWPAAWDLYVNQEKCPQMTVLEWWAEWPTPRTFLFGGWFKEDSPLFNWSYYHNPEYERLVNEGIGYEATDKKKAFALYSQAQQMLLDDAASFFVYDSKSVMFKRKDIKGLKLSPLYLSAIWTYGLTRE